VPRAAAGGATVCAAPGGVGDARERALPGMRHPVGPRLPGAGGLPGVHDGARRSRAADRCSRPWPAMGHPSAPRGAVDGIPATGRSLAGPSLAAHWQQRHAGPGTCHRRDRREGVVEEAHVDAGYRLGDHGRWEDERDDHRRHRGAVPAWMPVSSRTRLDRARRHCWCNRCTGTRRQGCTAMPATLPGTRCSPHPFVT
jgi:hypothetical protein